MVCAFTVNAVGFGFGWGVARGAFMLFAAMKASKAIAALVFDVTDSITDRTDSNWWDVSIYTAAHTIYGYIVR